MRKTLILVMLAAALTCAAGDGVERLFAEEPGTLFNSLTYSARYELLNKFKQNKSDEVLNNFQTNETRILKLSEKHLVVATSSSRTVELKLIALPKNDTVLAVLETVSTPVKDSRLSFYDLNWNRLDDSQFIAMPTTADFFVPKVSKELRDELLNQLSFAMIEMEFEGDTLVARCNLKDFYMGNDFKHYEKWVRPSIAYVLNKGKFKMKK